MDKNVKGILVDIAILLGLSFLILVLAEIVCEFFPKLSTFVLILEIICGIIFWIIIIFSIIGKKTLGHRIAENFDKNKKFFIAICCFTVFSFILYFWNMNFNPYYYYPKIESNYKLQVEQYSEITNYYGISSISNGKITTKEKVIDTSKIGKKKIELIIENKYGKKREYTYYIDVVKELEKCELSFRDIDDKLLFGKEFLKDESAHIVRDKYGKPSIHIDFKDKDKAFEKTNEFSKRQNNMIVIWKNFDEATDSYKKEENNCGTQDSKCLSAAVVSHGFSDYISIVGNANQDLVNCINNSWN